MEHENADAEGPRRRRQVQRRNNSGGHVPEQYPVTRKTGSTGVPLNVPETDNVERQLVNLANDDNDDDDEPSMLMERPLKRAHRAVAPPAL